MVIAVEKDIQIPVKNEADKARERIKKFEELLKEFQQALRKEIFYSYQSGVSFSLDRISLMQEKIEDLEDQCKEYLYFAQMFEFPKEMEGSFKLLEAVKQELAAVFSLWKYIERCQHIFDGYLEIA